MDTQPNKYLGPGCNHGARLIFKRCQGRTVPLRFSPTLIRSLNIISDGICCERLSVMSTSPALCKGLMSDVNV
jgi:hypothetical protein